jgi:hypothetical protein
MTVALSAASVAGKYPNSSDITANGGAARDGRGSAARTAAAAAAAAAATAADERAATPRRKSSREDVAADDAPPPPVDDRRDRGGDGGEEDGVHAATYRRRKDDDSDAIAHRAKKRHETTGRNIVTAIVLSLLLPIPTNMLFLLFYSPCQNDGQTLLFLPPRPAAPATADSKKIFYHREKRVLSWSLPSIILSGKNVSLSGDHRTRHIIREGVGAPSRLDRDVRPPLPR